jgi:hypothetical protein
MFCHLLNPPCPPLQNLERDTTNRYGPNSFKLFATAYSLSLFMNARVANSSPSHASCRSHRLPTPRPGQVLGLVGTNGIGRRPLPSATVQLFPVNCRSCNLPGSATAAFLSCFHAFAFVSNLPIQASQLR